MVIYEFLHVYQQYPWDSVYHLGTAESISSLIIEGVKRNESPLISEDIAGSVLCNLIKSTWNTNPNLRPDADHIMAII